jgi:hypothetical protein
MSVLKEGFLFTFIFGGVYATLIHSHVFREMASKQDSMQMVAELEMEMMSDMYRRMTNACQQKCVASHYKEGDLTKGEAVCLDRCVAK